MLTFPPVSSKVSRTQDFHQTVRSTQQRRTNQPANQPAPSPCLTQRPSHTQIKQHTYQMLPVDVLHARLGPRQLRAHCFKRDQQIAVAQLGRPVFRTEGCRRRKQAANLLATLPTKPTHTPTHTHTHTRTHTTPPMRPTNQPTNQPAGEQDLKAWSYSSTVRTYLPPYPFALSVGGKKKNFLWWVDSEPTCGKHTLRAPPVPPSHRQATNR